MIRWLWKFLVIIFLGIAVAAMGLRMHHWHRLYGEDLDDLFATVRKHSLACFMKDHDLQEKLIWAEEFLRSRMVYTENTYRGGMKSLGKLLHPYHINVFLNGEDYGTDQPAFEWDYTSTANDEIMAHFRSCNLTHDAKSKERLEQLLAVLKSDKINAITFDMRGNGGGSSRYGSAIIEAIFGEHADWISEHVATHYRLTAENLEHLAARGESSIETLKHHFEMRENVYTLNYATHYPEIKKRVEQLLRRDHLPKIRVLMDDRLFSSAADFVVQLKVFIPDMEIIGDSGIFEYGYADIHCQPLKSQLGQFIFPMKYFEMNEDKAMRVVPTFIN